MNPRLQQATLVELLQERRANVLEQIRETDEVAKAMLQAHINEIDAELARRKTVKP